MINVEQDVLCLGGEDTQLVSTMDGYVCAVEADLVVLASQQLSSTTLQTRCGTRVCVCECVHVRVRVVRATL